ncbi:MAG: hypothetical protein N2312_03035 [Dictyoglomaceae bacterium]|nr:hypothetical protein [Dictyoglomaceae bacterium]
MKKYLLFCFIFIILLFSNTLSKEIKEKDLWRYDLEKAIIFALNEENLLLISNIALSLQGNSIQESIWNILRWERDNIKYDFEKASLPEPIIRIWSTGKIEIIQGEKNIFQTPYETIKLGKGTCNDYALLTAGLMLKMGYEPIYILDIVFQNDPIGHTALGVIIGGWLFILDQNPPPMDAGTYYKHWIYEEGKIIKKIIAYEINKNPKDLILKYSVNIEDFKRQDYEITSEVMDYISLSLMKIVKENFPHLSIDTQISFLDKMSNLPRGYSRGKILFFEFPQFLEYYHPIFHNQFVKDLWENITQDNKVYQDFKNYNSFFIRSEKGERGIYIIINLASI